ncbi:hypothetical protein RSOL_434580 [Rhizoctonia solani AG-3 Rhs1AP]|uniref:Uncharacterized protein n=1 Tax=Rhizoctonia solani AG-3 Rhs1AP TaxID=1086054 RepID=X8JJ97_9AGAM|nr:hypothetical protein RSOL_434580 [Rhizoctonia solani AG-3 Rhs1AP]
MTKASTFGPPEPRPPHRSASKSSTRNLKRKRMPGIDEKQGDSAALPDNVDSELNSPISLDMNDDGQHVHIVGIDDRLKHQFVDVLSRNGPWVKVHGYLATSLHQRYDYQVEEIGDSVEGNDVSRHDNLLQDV